MTNTSNVAKTMVKLANLPEILRAAEVLERNGLLLNGEQATDVLKRYVEANPDINTALSKAGRPTAKF